MLLYNLKKFNKMDYQQAEAKLHKYEYLINKSFRDKRLNNSIVKIVNFEIKEINNGFIVYCITDKSIGCTLEYALENFENV